jgi:hypothetical protein
MTLCILNKEWSEQRGRLLLLAYDVMYPEWRFPRMGPLIRATCIQGLPWLPLARRAGRAHHLMSLLLRITFNNVWFYERMNDEEDRINEMMIGRGPPEGVTLREVEVADADEVVPLRTGSSDAVVWLYFDKRFAEGYHPQGRVNMLCVTRFDANVLWAARPLHELFWHSTMPLSYTSTWEMDFSALVRLAYPHEHETEAELVARDAVSFA